MNKVKISRGYIKQIIREEHKKLLNEARFHKTGDEPGDKERAYMPSKRMRLLRRKLFEYLTNHPEAEKTIPYNLTAVFNSTTFDDEFEEYVDRLKEYLPQGFFEEN